MYEEGIVVVTVVSQSRQSGLGLLSLKSDSDTNKSGFDESVLGYTFVGIIVEESVSCLSSNSADFFLTQGL